MTTLTIMTLCMTLSRGTQSIMTLRIMSLSVMTLSITSSIIALSILTLSIKIFSMSPTLKTTAGSKMTQPNGMLSVVILNVVVPNSPHPTIQHKKTKYL
jgi:hypothetical protein